MKVIPGYLLVVLGALTFLISGMFIGEHHNFTKNLVVTNTVAVTDQVYKVDYLTITQTHFGDGLRLPPNWGYSLDDLQLMINSTNMPPPLEINLFNGSKILDQIQECSNECIMGISSNNSSGLSE